MPAQMMTTATAMAILPLVFAVSPTAAQATQALESGDTGLTFIYLTKFFPTLPAGSLIAGLFFLALLALIGIVEVVDYAACHAGGGG